VNTLDGTYKVVKIKGISGPGATGGFCDGTEYAIYGTFASYNSATLGAPVPLNSTVSFSNLWAKIIIGSDAEDADQPGTSSGFPARRPILSRTSGSINQFPCIAGTCYTSQGQILRRVDAEDTKTVPGPSVGKTRRAHYGAFLWHQALAVKIGTVFGKLKRVLFRTGDGSGRDQRRPNTPLMPAY
jgi:hypothetical protein